MKQLNIIAFLVFLGALAWVFVLKPDTISSMRATFLGWFSPVVKASGAMQAEAVPEDLRSREELLTVLKRLEEEAVNLRFRQRGLSDLEEENSRLRADLEFREKKHYDLTIPAQVIKRNRSNWWSTVIINRGTDHGVSRDLPVIDRNHGVVGKVTPNGLTKDMAEVLILTDEQCQVAAQIGRNVSMQGIVMGHRGLGNLAPEVRLNYLNPDIRLPAGTVLYTDNIAGQVFPPGLLIGRVVQQIKGEYYDSATVDPQVDFDHLDSVFVIAKVDESEKAVEGEPTATVTEKEGVE